MIYKIVSFLILYLTIQAPLFSQSEHTFKEGLFLPLDMKYGREALVKDEVVYALSRNAFEYPSNDNSTFSSSEGDIEWKKISADSTGDFAGESLSEGYLYLSYNSDKAQTAFLNISGHNMVFFNGTPHGGDIYKYGWLYSPVKLEKGKNNILIRCSRWAKWQGITAKMVFPEKPVTFGTEDTTLPHVVLGQDNKELLGAVVLINASQNELKGLAITSKIEGKELSYSLPSIPAMTTRKVPFKFNGEGIIAKGSYTCQLRLTDKSNMIDDVELMIEAVNPEDHYSNTFVSDIDGSVQYYSVTPRSGSADESPALFLSVHGAGVEAIGQARAYDSKDWGVLVAATNRRPRGFNWEEWGRIDALEVLEIAKTKFQPDPEKIYLTGHSMGGHGTWYLGATYPDKWAAIGPCAGYPTLTAYGSSDGKIPDETMEETEKILLQASNPSNVLELIKNYSSAGVYIHHGDSDKVVSVDYARQMRGLLADFHKDFSYYEYPRGSHWFGDESVDWPPMFEYFKWHSIPADTSVDVVDFTTADPAISSQYFWVGILQQQHSLKYSKVNLRRSRPDKLIKGTTSNVSTLSFNLGGFSPGDTLKIVLDDQKPLTYMVRSDEDVIYLNNSEGWAFGNAPEISHKGIARGSTFKDPFNHKMVLVYGTGGSDEENKWAYEKAVYDAEVWYYRGNGALDIIADKDFKPSQYPDRGVIIYGNSKTNKAWNKLLKDCPVQVNTNGIFVGGRQYSGDDLAAYFMWPRQDSKIASVAVIGGTGLTGMKSTEANQYFAAGSGFPDFMVFSSGMLKESLDGIKCTGFYTNDWKVDKDNSVFSE